MGILHTLLPHVRICLYVIQVTFTVYLCSVVVHSSWNYVAMGISRLQLQCTKRSTAATGFTMNVWYIVAYAQAYAPCWSCIWEFLGSQLAWRHLFVCMYVWRCSHKFTEPNYRSALRVVFPTRLTIVRSLLWSNVHKGNKRTKTSFFKPGFVTLKLCMTE